MSELSEIFVRAGSIAITDERGRGGRIVVSAWPRDGGLSPPLKGYGDDLAGAIADVLHRLVPEESED